MWNKIKHIHTVSIQETASGDHMEPSHIVALLVAQESKVEQG